MPNEFSFIHSFIYSFIYSFIFTINHHNTLEYIFKKIKYTILTKLLTKLNV